MQRFRNRRLEITGLDSGIYPTGPQWEVQVTRFKDLETGDKYSWWSDRVLYDVFDILGRYAQVGDVLIVSATPVPQVNKFGRTFDIRLRQVKLHRIA